MANQIRAQLEEHEGVGSMAIGADADGDQEQGEEVPECRVIISVSGIKQPRTTTEMNLTYNDRWMYK